MLGIISLNKPYSYNQLVKAASLLSIAYPEFLQVEIIGTTVSNRSIFMIRAGRGKRGILLTGGVHGRESINPVAIMAMLEEYAYAYTNPRERDTLQKRWKIDLQVFFQEFTLYTIPLVNPDGYMIALTGFHIIDNKEQLEHAKSKNIPYQEWKFNQNAVDINRNFPSASWRPKFEGDEVGSELETKALMRVMLEYKTEAYIDYHSRGDEIYYYRGQMSVEYNAKQLKLAKALSLLTGYKLVPPEREINVGETGGNTVHFYSEQTENPAFTIETIPEEEQFPLSLRYQRTVYCQLFYTPFAVAFNEWF